MTKEFLSGNFNRMEHNKLHDYVESRNLIYTFNNTREKNAEQKRKHELPRVTHDGGGR